MTRLRDDGLLETDDLFVAACFLGREVIFVGHKDEARKGILYSVWHWRKDRNEWFQRNDCATKKLWIPAETVRDVWFQEPWSREMLILESAINGPEGYFTIGAPCRLADWLDEHIPPEKRYEKL